MPKTTTKLSLTDPKKHSVRYDATNEGGPGEGSPGDPPALRTIYVAKTALSEPWPKEITVTIEY